MKWFMPFVMAAMLAMTGCTTAQKASVDNAVTTVVTTLEKNTATVQAGAALATQQGLKLLADKHPDDAKLAAGLLSAQASAAAAYFSGSTPPLGVDAQATMQAIGYNVPASAGPLVQIVDGTLKVLVTIPDANTVVTPDQCRLIAAFCQGIVQGCAAYK